MPQLAKHLDNNQILKISINILAYKSICIFIKQYPYILTSNSLLFRIQRVSYIIITITIIKKLFIQSLASARQWMIIESQKNVNNAKPSNFRSLKDLLNNRDGNGNKFIRDKNKQNISIKNKQNIKQADKQNAKQINKQANKKNINNSSKQIKLLGKYITNQNQSIAPLPKTKKEIFQHRDARKPQKNKSLSIQNIITPRLKEQSCNNDSNSNRKKGYQDYQQEIIKYLLKHQKQIEKYKSQQINNKQISSSSTKIKPDPQQQYLQQFITSLQPQLNKIFILHQGLGLKQETLYLGLTYYKQYLTHLLSNTNKINKIDKSDDIISSVDSDSLILIGVACLWIAGKYQQIYPPKSKYYVKFLQKNTIQQLKNMQQKIMSYLQFNFQRNTPYNFLLILLPQQNSNIFCLANYLLQSYFYKNIFFQQEASLLALTAVKTAQLIYNNNKDTAIGKIQNKMNFQKFVNYSKQRISNCFKRLCQLLSSDSVKSTALKKRFSDAELHKVAKICLMHK